MIQVKVAIQGDGVAIKEFDEGTTLGEMKELLNLNPTLEFRVAGEKVDDNYTLGGEETVVGTKSVKGGIA